ncbi:hypothetical protein U1Q18_022208 [Sarracenia purpurea var. burkii]
MQDDISHATAVSRHPHPSRPASHSAFDESVENSESHYAHLPPELASVDALLSGASVQVMPMVQNIGSSASSHTYASALGTSLSRSTTPDPQFITRASSPHIPPVGGGRASSMDKRNVNGSNLFNGELTRMSEHTDLVDALSDMTLSTNGVVDEENHSRYLIQQEIDNDHQNLFHLQGDHIKHPYLNKTEPGHHLHSSLQSASYSNVGKGNGIGMGLNNYSLIADGPVELQKPAFTVNSYLKGSSTNLGSGGSLPSNYHNLDSPNSSFSNYGFSGYAAYPTSPSLMGNQTTNLPPLFENVAAASAMGASGMDSRALVGGFTIGPNLMAAAEMQNLNRFGNHSAGSALQMPLVDPMYLQYLRTAEYAAAQAAALNDPPLEMEGFGNSYTDLIGLQKAYLGTLLSPHKSQYGLQYLDKSGSLNHNYYGSPTFGLGSYPGSPLAGSLLPNSPIGSGSPLRHDERNVRFPSGLRNLAGSVLGSWHPEAGGNLDEHFGSSLLDEFKSNKTKCFELLEIAGHVVEFRLLISDKL